MLDVGYTMNEVWFSMVYVWFYLIYFYGEISIIVNFLIYNIKINSEVF